jgi:ABC-2 type transport system permease protein
VTEAPTRRGIHERLARLDQAAPTAFDPRRTLRLRVEFTRQLKRRRTQMAFLILLVLPIVVALALSLGANVVLPAWSMVVGEVFFGNAAARSPLGGTFAFGETLWRLAIIVAYASGQSLVVAALAFLLSVSVDNPLGAVGGATMLVVVSNILDQITALDPYRRFLPTHFQFSWLDALGPNVVWDDMLRGTGLALVYSAVFFAIAWLRFDRKDITS